MRRRALLLAIAAAALGSPLEAQRGPGLEIQLPTASRVTEEGPLVRARGVLADKRMRELLESGFPARLRYRVELWSSARFADELHRAVEWEVLVRWRGTDQRYEVSQRVGERVLSLGSFVRLDDALAAVGRPLRVPVAAPTRNRLYYYQASLEVRTLSVSDLDEVNAWLRGELTPAMRGERNPGTAFTRGLRNLTTRLLGGERREYAARTSTFRPPR
ncbi:MAG: hypothetical protein KF689_11090 [Gemmatimonadaceae bacterium]|nr:hypothetical protein [Gemmatimonadaceae bacterium]MCW5825860.1 hypothetical protein [Gemmatimonadaceae bacterium]